MTFRLGAELADRVAAIAPHSGTCWTEVLSPARAVSACYLTGTADSLNPIEGGFPKLAMGGKDQGGRSKPPVSNMIAKWAKVLECADEPIMEEIVSGVRTSRYGQGRDDAEVLCITIEGLGHHWAGGKPPVKKLKKNKLELHAIRLSDIRCKERLGGLLRSYSRVAA